MGNDQINKSERRGQYTDFLIEIKKFLLEDQTPFQFIQNFNEDQHINIKETSDLARNLNTTNIVDYALNIYSNILSFKKTINNSLYSPITILKYKMSDNDSIDSFSSQVIYINDLIEHNQLRKNNDDNGRLIALKNNTEKMINIKLKEIHFSEAEQNTSDKQYLFYTPNVGNTPNQVNHQNSSNINGNEIPISLFERKQSQKLDISNNQTEKEQKNRKQNEGRDKKYQKFISSVINNIPSSSNKLPIHFKIKPDFSNNPLLENIPPYIIEVSKGTHLKSKNEVRIKAKPNLTQCKKYFKLKREIEEEKIKKTSHSSIPTKRKSIHLKIDIRKIPTIHDQVDDSSNISNDNYNFFIHPDLKHNNEIYDNNINGIATFGQEENKTSLVNKSRSLIEMNDENKTKNLIKRRKTVENMPTK